MAPTLKHLKSHKTPPGTKMSPGRSTAPAVQAIIVNCVSVVNPQLAPIIGDKLEVVMARLEDSQAACPTHREVIPAAIARPIATCVTIVHIMFPASQVGSAPIEVLAAPSLTKVEGVLPEKASTISGGSATLLATTFATGTHNSPSVSSIGTMVSEEHPCMATAFKHLKSYKMPPSTHTPSGHTIAPAMQAIVVNCVPIVNPQLAPIIRVNAKVVRAFPEDSQAARPTHGEMIASSEAGPSATCVAIVHHVFPASHVWSATLQVLATPTLTKVESILPEETMTVHDFVHGVSSAARASHSPAVSSVRAMVPEQHPSMTTTLKELNSHNAPSTTHLPFCHPTAPTMQAVVVNCVLIIDPELASIIGYKLEVVGAAPKDSHASCPTHREVIAS